VSTPDAARDLMSDQELEAAFGGDLGPAPSASAAPSALGAPQTGQAVVFHPEHRPTWTEFARGWEIGIYRDPVLCGVTAGVVLGMLGVFIVLRRAVFVTAAISQSAALGVALAFLLHARTDIALPPSVAALGLALIAALTLAFQSERLRVPREALIGFAYLAASAAAILVGDRITQEAHDISAILFGTAVVVRPADLLLVATAGIVVLCVVGVAHRGLLFAGFDPEGARVQGLPVRSLETVLWTLVALEVSVATRALGALPVFAFAVLPALSALSLVERPAGALLIASLFGGTAGGLGYLAAFFFEFPVGACQAVVVTLGFLVALPLALARAR